MKRILFLLLFSILLVSSASALISESQDNGNDPGDYANSINIESAQTFTIGTTGLNTSFIITSISLFARGATNDNNVTLTLRNVNSTGYPVGSNFSSINKVFNQTNASWIAYNFSNGIVLNKGGKYAIHIKFNAGNPANWQNVTNGYSGGSVFYSADNGSTWSIQTNTDWIFKIYGFINNTVGVELISPSNDSTLSTAADQVTLTAKGLPISGNLTNATFYLWNSSGTLVGTNITTVTGRVENVTSAIISSLSTYGTSFVWNALFCSTNSSSQHACAFAQANFTFMTGVLESSNYSNLTTYESAREFFFANFTSVSSLIPASAVLLYDNTSSSATLTQVSTNVYNVTSSINIPLGSGNKDWKFRITFDNGNKQNLSTHTQSVGAINFTLCDASAQTVPYINISYRNDTLLQERVTASLISTWTYWLGTGSINRTYSFTNTTENFANTFCFSPANRTMFSSYSLNYYNSYSVQRSYSATAESISNSTTQKILYLLPTSEGIYVTFQVINNAEQTVSGASINVTKSSDGSLIGSTTTDSAGSATFFLDPDISYTLIVTADGYEDYTTSITPTQTSYTITLGSSSIGDADDFSRGITYSVTPTNKTLQNGTTYLFNFSVASSFWTIDSFGFYLRNATGIITSVSSSNNGGSVSYSFNTGNNTLIYMQYYWLIDGNYTNATTTWTVYNLYDSDWSILRFFTDLRLYTSQGMFGMTDTALTIIVFIIIFFITGFMSYKFGLNSPAAIAGILFALVGFFDVGLGMIASPLNAIPHFATMLIGVIFASVLVREALN